MTVVLNGKPTDIPEGATVRQLLVARGLGDKPCAVEVNRALVPRRAHEEHVLREGDAVEVVTLVGGG
ncbi:MAG: sulfur carrier protein ThiS [Phycisphaerales bacterium]|nr:sulfur carrier protein ThiS [Phycisphaerales bacterium]